MGQQIDRSYFIGAVQDLQEGGQGLRFKVRRLTDGEIIPAFALRYDYQVFAYLNRCGHIAVELDYLPGQFFTDDGQTLMCSTHGAEYAPDTGACLGGPCFGIGLEPLPVNEQDGDLYLENSNFEVVEN